MKRILLCLFLFTSACCLRGPQGVQGNRGASGLVGAPGIDGSSCSVESVSNGAVITCEDGTSTVILNGADGQDGSDAQPTAYSIVEVIKPCPGSGYREVLLRTYNGEILAHYSHGSKQFLTFLTPGNYQLTDGSSCNFTVHSDMSVTW
jgi:hypothetical protein